MDLFIGLVALFFFIIFNFFILIIFYFKILIILFYFYYLFILFFSPFSSEPCADTVLVLWPGVRPEPLRWESRAQDIGPPETSWPHVISIGESSPRSPSQH